LKIWYDDLLKRLNVDGRGKYLGEFDGDDKILQVNEAGWYELTSFDLSNHFDPGIVLMQKYNPEQVYGLVHYDTKAKNYFVKRFVFEMQPAGKEVSIISEEPGSKMIFITGKPDAQVQVDVEKGKSKTPETLIVDLAGLIDVKGLKANGNRLSQHEVKKVKLVDATSEIGIELVEPTVVDEVEPHAVDVDEEIDLVEDSGFDDGSNNSSEIVEEMTIEEVVPEMVEAEQSEIPTANVGEAEPSEIKVVEEKPQKDTPKKKPVFKTEPIKAEPKPAATNEVEQSEISTDKPEESKPAKTIDFEITNPDDIKIDDKGQLGFF
jgi:topoisomerase-4 subunit A